MTIDTWPSTTSTSFTDTMFACDSDAAIRASSNSICIACGFVASWSDRRLMTTSLSKPAIPTLRARYSSAMPPLASRHTTS